MTAGARKALGSVLAEAGWAADPAGLEIVDGPTAIAAWPPVSDIAAGADGALALAAAELARIRGGAHPAPFVERRLAGLATAGNEYLTIEKSTPRTWGNITGYHRCRCGNAVYVHGIFPHLRDGLLELFGAEDSRESMSARIAGWTADEAEAAGQSRGLCVVRMRTRAEWEAHPQRTALAATPLIAMKGVEAASGPRAPLHASEPGALPLAGLRVLDLSRVIAGPMAGRALAELGADVLRVSAAHLPAIPALAIDTGFGKRNAEIDLRTEAGRETLRALIREADVLIDGYRPGALAAKGFGAADLARLNPGLTLVEFSAFGTTGPWAGRRGYDTYVQAAVGFTAPADPAAAPVRLPCQPLDYLTGCLSAFAAVLGLIRRAETGRGSSAELALARTAMWIWEVADLIGAEPAPPPRNPTLEEVRAEGLIRTMASEFGEIGALAPPYGFDGHRVAWPSPPRALGGDPPVWRER